MSTCLYKLLGRGGDYAPDAVGIEIEVERATTAVTYMRNHLYPQHWAHKHDGSLRDNGVEFVSAALPLADLSPGLDIIETALAVKRARATWRCGLHLHQNMLPFTIEQIHRVLVAYAALEGCLYETFGWERANNQFAVPLHWSPAATQQMGKAMVMGSTRPNMFLRYCNSWPKYSAINIRTLVNFGTIEYRFHRGTYRSEEICRFVTIMGGLKDWAMDFKGTVVELCDYMQANLAQIAQDLGLTYATEALEECIEGAYEVAGVWEIEVEVTEDEWREAHTEAVIARPEGGPVQGTWQQTPYATATPHVEPDEDAAAIRQQRDAALRRALDMYAAAADARHNTIREREIGE